ncbi:MAG: SCP2 sterol-binding domain-containing protein [Proteobacteria bacterium]|nr:SCP2 sterol-binding domain-containing protein [Pseudomonadota bacterium]
MPYTHGTQEWEEAYTAVTKKRMDSEKKPYIYFMPEWVGAWEEFLKADPVYKSVALPDWKGAVVLHVLKNADYGVEQDIYVYLDLLANQVRSIRIVPSDYGKSGAFVITGTIERWMAVGKKELDVVKGMMQGKLKLKGNLPAIVRAIKPAVRLVDAAAEVGGLMPDAWTPEIIESIKETIKNMAAEFNIN